MDIEQIISQLRQAIKPEKSVIQHILREALPLFEKEPNILELNGPLTICGDTHGQLDDALHLFEVSGEIPSVRYLFLGDYVDRGYFSVELITLLLCYKIKYPDSIYLLRGNHESRAVNISYGFYDECLTKLDEPTWYDFNDFFDYLPLAAIVNNEFFCVHGGLSPNLINLKDLRDYDRVCEPDLTTFVGHLLWSDPGDVDEWQRTERRCGYLFGEKHCKDFLDENHLKMIIRSHEMVDGCEIKFKGLLATIWSAPNYCYFCVNQASFMKVKEDGSYEFCVFGPMPDERRFPAPKSVNNYFNQ
ncbi:Serine/threonine-protein phosphatase 6 catalytic subunit [Tritrichomonas musculus]|uniref:Serine/threonine-protein phosphatase n=1 Tax=Tritrichomonas musculus TaxID=1915356 RepID=A0ABR2KRY0_9EUKA